MRMLDGRSAIVTGGADGLGLAFARRLAAEGADVTLCDIDADAPDVAAAMDGPGKVQGLVADVSNLDGLRRVVEAARDAYGGVDLLVNNAGRWRRTPMTDSYDKAVEDWDFIMGTNFTGVLLLSRLCIPLMIERGGGDIVNISTYYVLPARSPGTNAPETDLYNASKWALNGFTQAWANALEEHGIRVNALCMGAVDTPMLRGLWDGDPPVELVETWMRPEQIAGLLIDLIKDGRSGENIGAWVGEPVELGPRKPAHRTVTG
ncbi:MAG: SDR family NAD(P)-dependent oxidoreductase [Gammaproteobacteria bacterium]|nr:SDR family NAD(P)-dependent oxidoreductase [Gammaproteobacteria bacterium]